MRCSRRAREVHRADRDSLTWGAYQAYGDPGFRLAPAARAGASVAPSLTVSELRRRIRATAGTVSDRTSSVSSLRRAIAAVGEAASRVDRRRRRACRRLPSPRGRSPVRRRARRRSRPTSTPTSPRPGPSWAASIAPSSSTRRPWPVVARRAGDRRWSSSPTSRCAGPSSCTTAGCGADGSSHDAERLAHGARRAR